MVSEIMNPVGNEWCNAYEPYICVAVAMLEPRMAVEICPQRTCKNDTKTI